MSSNKSLTVFVAGHKGMVGSALVRKLRAAGYTNILVADRAELDLLNQGEVYKYLLNKKPDYIFIAAAKVGGIHANNTYRADFIYQNIMIEANLIHGAHLAGVQRLMLLGSSCIYPRNCPQPIKEEYLLTGLLEHTNEPYAIAKIAGIKMCENYNIQYDRNYISVMPTNLYGPNDNYDYQNSHVLPALMRKIHDAKHAKASEISVWGTGKPKREFLYVDDLADACIHLFESEYNGPLINIGTGQDIAIEDLVKFIMRVIGYNGTIIYDNSKPDGTPRKILDVGKINTLGWHAKTELEEGIHLAYASAPFNK